MTVLRICKIWDSEYPWDVRVEKVARTLSAAGHEVHLVARNRDRRPQRERLPEAALHRLTPWRFFGKRFDAASSFPAFFNPRWMRAILRTPSGFHWIMRKPQLIEAREHWVLPER